MKNDVKWENKHSTGDNMIFVVKMDGILFWGKLGMYKGSCTGMALKSL
jgi:hypothetical protein